MTPGLYRFAITLGIFMAIALALQSIFYFILDTAFVSIPTYYTWFAGLSLLSTAWAAVWLKYLHYHKFRLALVTGVIPTIAGLIQFIVVTNIFVGNRQLAPTFGMVMILIGITSIVHFATVAFSDSGKRNWIKVGAIISLALNVVSVLVIISIAILAGNADKDSLAFLIQQWLTAAAPFSIIPFIINYREELKSRQNQPVDPTESQGKFESGLISAGAVVIMISCVIAAPTLVEVLNKAVWNRQLANKVDKVWYYENHKYSTLSYQLLKPIDYDSTKKYPIVVCLPYDGGVEGCPPAQWLADPQQRKKYQSFIFVPFCEPGQSWGGVDNYTTVDEIVFECIDSLQNKLASIDEDRVYVTGISKGGYGSWHFICSRPDMFAAAMPVCGAGDPELAAKITNLGVWAFHGAKDKNVPVEGSRDMINAMKNSGGNPTYTEFEGAAHNIWSIVMATDGVLDWLFEQRRKGSINQN